MSFFIFLVGLSLCLFALINRKAALLLLPALAPLYLVRFGIYGIPTTLLEILILSVIVLHIFKDYKPLQTTLTKIVHTKKILFPILALSLATIISIVVAPSPLAALGLARAYIVEPLIIALILFATCKTTDYKVIAASTSYTALAIAIGAFLQYHGEIPFPNPTWAKELRLTSFYPFPNAIGLYLAPLIPLFIWRIKETFGINRVWYSAITLITLTTIFFAQSEGALIAIIGTALIAGILHGKILRRLSISAIIAGMALVALIAPLQQKIFLQDWSGTVRRFMWNETTTMLTSSPRYFFLGAGLSGYPKAVKPFHKTTIEIFQYPHTLVYNLWTELGLLGLLSIMSILALSLHAHFREHSSTHRALALSLIIMIIHGLVDVPFFKNDLAILTAFLLVLPRD